MPAALADASPVCADAPADEVVNVRSMPQAKTQFPCCKLVLSCNINRDYDILLACQE
jgi:hypothetical protein